MSASPIVIDNACILGAGAFGFALAKLLGDNNPKLPIRIYDPIKAYIEGIQKTKQHPVFHKGVSLSDNVQGILELKAAIENANLIVLAVPGAYIRSSVKEFIPFVNRDIVIVNVAKALEPETNKFLSVVCEEELTKLKHKHYFAALAGGMIADEVTKLYPIAADVACENIGVAEQVKKLFETPKFKLNTLTDVLGVELAGALKNVVAIGAGIIDGLGYDTSSKAAFVSGAAKEMQLIASHLGAHAETFGLGTHAWLNDLLTTCFGQSRNRYFGELLGKGTSVKDALDKLEQEKKRSEGYVSVPGFYKLTQEKGIKAPIFASLYGILFEDKPAKSIEDLFKD